MSAAGDMGDLWNMRTGGWLVSGVVHGGAVALALYAGTDFSTRLQPETFRWDVVVQRAPAHTPPAAEDITPQQSVSRPVPPSPLPPTKPLPAKPLVRRTVERTPVAQTVQTHRPVQSSPRVIERSSSQERQTVTTEAQTFDAQPIQQGVVARAQEEVQQEIHESEQGSEQPTMAPLSRSVVEQASATVTEAAPAEVDRPAVVEQVAVRSGDAIATPETAFIEKASPVVSATAVMHQARVEHRTVREAAQPQADFGWLSESLWERIQQLKRYPLQARSRRWEGKVVLEAVIRQDGTILDCLVAESSGHGILDQDAMAVLRRASPLALKHPLGQEQITILVPIAYRLES